MLNSSSVFKCGNIGVHLQLSIIIDKSKVTNYAPVICIPGPLGAGDTEDIAGLKSRNLTSDVSRQCRGCAGVLISR